MSKPRRCFYIPATAFVAGCGYVPSIVVEGEPGHTPLGGGDTRPWYFGMTYEEARQRAEKENLEQFGITPAEARRIVASSMPWSCTVTNPDECPRCAATGVPLWFVRDEDRHLCRGCVVDVTGRDPEMILSGYNKPMLVRAYLLGVHLMLFPESDALTRRPNGEVASLLLGETENPDSLRESLRAISTELQSRGIDLTHL